MNDKDFTKIFEDTNALMYGHFILSSGLHSDQYVQCAKLLSHPKKAELICQLLKEFLKQIYDNEESFHNVIHPAILVS